MRIQNTTSSLKHANRWSHGIRIQNAICQLVTHVTWNVVAYHYIISLCDVQEEDELTRNHQPR